ncbi:uncharacterized protein LOC110835851 isoform X1 [Zootermopsis nevadensis]|uniref:uncharacterized protein LOC110835851 isoform X1 n=1 Tax=Zootermopsis nevadensis TaxID=136037 RepID=UPI000B8ED476|nr:uncharacterized protein LOC110835851 isoform X1 [Zootermopsis nevadensis]
MQSNSIKMHKMKQVLDCFCLFLNKYEHCEWMKGATKSEIHNGFQCAQDVEKICSVLETKGCVTAFEIKLSEWHKLKYGLVVHYKLQEFAAACDMILSNFYMNSDITDEVLMCATSEYLEICGRNRFHLLKEKLIFKAHTHDAVKNVIDELSTMVLEQKDVFKSTLSCELLRSVWTKYIRCKEASNISNCIHTTSNDSRFIESVLRILIKEDCSEEGKTMKKIITESLLLKMSTMNYQDPVFWHIIIVTNRHLIVTVCDLNPEICSVLVKFIVHVGKCMDIEFTEMNYIWKPKENAKLMVDVTFDDFVSLVRRFLESRGVAGDHMRRTLQDLKSQPDCSIWVEVERQCELPVLAKLVTANVRNDSSLMN